MGPLETYMKLFESLNIHVQDGQRAPHKPIMLLSIISLIEQGILVNNEIPLTDVIEKEFNAQWTKFVSPKSIYNPAVWTPFWHLKNEPFWHLKAKDGNDAAIDKLVGAGETASIGKMREAIKYASLDEDLFLLLTIEYSRNKIKLLLKTFL